MGCSIYPVCVALSYLLLQYGGLTGSATNQCSQPSNRVLEATEEISSLNMTRLEYYLSYPSDITCEWLLKAPGPGYMIRVHFAMLDTECFFDQLYFYDGKSFSDKLLGVFSGSNSTRDIYAHSGHMFIYFFSDSNTGGDGFTLDYSAVRIGSNESLALGSCLTSSDCQAGGSSDSNCHQHKCVCESGYSGVFCDRNDDPDITTDPKWHLMNAGSEAISMSGHSMVMTPGGVVYSYGGYDLNKASAHMYRSDNMYDFTLVDTSNSLLHPEGRYSHQMAYQTGNSVLYTSYGVPSSNETFGEKSLLVHGGVFTNGTLTDELWQFMIDTNTWRQLPWSPRPVADHVITLVDNRWLITHGGRTDDPSSNPISDMYIYDTKLYTWRQVKFELGFQPNLRLAGHTMVQHDYVLYVYGGYTVTSEAFRFVEQRLWKYYLKDNVWSQVEKDKHFSKSPERLVDHDAILYEDKMIIYGGKSDAGCVNGDVFVFDITCQKWINVMDTDISGIQRTLGQFGHSMLAYNNFLYVYGGMLGSLTNDVISIKLRSGLYTDDRSPYECLSCDYQTTCAGCVLSTGCVWCPADQICTQGTNPTCEMDSTWRTNTPLTDINSCVTDDKPSGWFYAVYKYPANYSRPDGVYLTDNSYVQWILHEYDYNCSTCLSHAVMKGYLVERPEGALGSRYRFSARGCTADLSIAEESGTSLNIRHITTIFSTHSQKFENVTPEELAAGSGYILLKSHAAGYAWYTAMPKFGLLGVYNPGIDFRKLKPYTSGNCSSYHNCMLCSADIDCGWCDSQSQCVDRELATCGDESDWLITFPSYCTNCTIYNNCHTCTESELGCQWLSSDKVCVRLGRNMTSIRTRDACPTLCHQKTNCTDCTMVDDEDCFWCTTSGKCLHSNQYQLVHPYGECLHYHSFHSDEKCTDCSQFTNCTECSAGHFCGWCSNNENPSIGVCIAGDFHAPHHDQVCTEAITSTHNVSGDATWSFGECPDLLECSRGVHNCVEHADCVETLEAYECVCKQGYTGIGIEECKKTCDYDCIHGTCVQYNETDFECECDLGWTGAACDTDCLCNNHSTCENGPGHCDSCQHFTTGEFCEECELNSYGDATNQSIACEKCQCNNHGDPSHQCDSTTGICNCIDRATGPTCSQCKQGYFGDPRYGGECFECYYGRTTITNFTGSSNYGSRFCHKGLGFSNATTFMWIFNMEETVEPSPRHKRQANNNQAGLVFELSSLDSKIINPVYVYDTLPDSVINENIALATLTNKDIGVVISSPGGYLAVVYYVQSPSDDALLKFKITSRQCPGDCFQQTSLCSAEGECVCRDGYVGADCQSMLSCVSRANSTDQDCGTETDYFPSRTRSASAQSTEANLYLIHGGISTSGDILSSYALFDLNTRQLTYTGSDAGAPSSRYGHAAVCTNTSCYIYGGVTAGSHPGSRRITDYKGLSPLGVSSEMWRLDVQTLTWQTRENKIVPELTGHSLTYIDSGSPPSIILIGGMTSELVWNPYVYVYGPAGWKSQNATGAQPKGLMHHACVYHEETHSLYIVPGQEPEESLSVDTGMYILDIQNYVWRKRIYNSLVSRTGHYLFTSAEFLIMIGGDYSHSDTGPLPLALDTREAVKMYSYQCDAWYTVLATDIAGNVQHEAIIGYTYLPSEDTNNTNQTNHTIVSPDQVSNGHILVISADQTTTLIGSFKIPDVCSWHQETSLLPVDLGTDDMIPAMPRGCHRCVNAHNQLYDFTYSPIPPDVNSYKELTCNSTQMCSYNNIQNSAQCELIQSCEVCKSKLPYYGSEPSFCVWDGTKCTKRNLQTQLEQRPCKEDQCMIHTSCKGCTSIVGCEWVAPEEPNRYVFSFCQDTGASSPGNAGYVSISSPGECVDTSLIAPCSACIQREPSVHTQPYSHSSASHLWNLNQQYCMVSDMTVMLDNSHLGNVVSFDRSCLLNCALNKQCSTCQAQPHCGWCSIAGSDSGNGTCMEGSLTHSDSCITDSLRTQLALPEIAGVQWNYLRCPAENECENDHHTCDEDKETCVNQEIGFSCECKAGYTAVTLPEDVIYKQACSSRRGIIPWHDVESDPICIPTCTPACQQGCCTDADTCLCDLGYVGELCELECECNGHSSCLASDLSNCTACQHNTAGDNCEYCDVGFVGDPTLGETCTPCNEVCFNRSDTCFSLEMAWPTRHGPKSKDRTQCANCGANSRGKLCHECAPGYFEIDNNCEACKCNGHGDSNTCEPNGTGCKCMNNTISKSDDFLNQCNECERDFEGLPTDNHQCYRIINIDNTQCFNAEGSSSLCNPIPRGQAGYYVLHTRNLQGLSNIPTIYTNVDVRLEFRVDEGAADIYVARSPSAFIVTYDPDHNEHVIEIDQSGDALNDPTMTGHQITSRAIADFETNGTVTQVKSHQVDAEDKYAVYHHFYQIEGQPTHILQLTAVSYLATVIFPHRDLTQDKYYIIVKSRGIHTSGRLKFTQDIPKINIFVFTNVFLCGVLLILCTITISWKFRQLRAIQQLHARREEELNQMAERPFSSKIMYLDLSGEAFKPGANNIPFNVVPLALEPLHNSSAAVATAFMLLPGDESRPMKAAMATTLLTWKITFPPTSKSKDRNSGANKNVVSEAQIDIQVDETTV